MSLVRQQVARRRVEEMVEACYACKGEQFTELAIAAMGSRQAMLAFDMAGGASAPDVLRVHMARLLSLPLYRLAAIYKFDGATMTEALRHGRALFEASLC